MTTETTTSEATVSAASTLFGSPDAVTTTVVEVPKVEVTPVESDSTKTDAPAEFKMPGKDATPEEWSKFYDQLGRPETADKYELPVPEGDDGTFAKKVAPMLHKAGLTGEQAKALAGDWNAMQAESVAAQQKEAQAEAQAQHVKNTAESNDLKREWGQQADANMEFAKRAATQFLPKESASQIINALEGVVGYKETIKLLHGIGKGLAEHGAEGMGTNNSSPTMSTAEKLYGKAAQ